MEELAPYMRGWRGYFGFCETPEVLIALTRWLERREERKRRRSAFSEGIIAPAFSIPQSRTDRRAFDLLRPWRRGRPDLRIS